jgi:hypothetical protein
MQGRPMTPSLPPTCGTAATLPNYRATAIAQVTCAEDQITPNIGPLLQMARSFSDPAG